MSLDVSSGSYALYKAQTKSVLSWLTDKGTECGVRSPKTRTLKSRTTGARATPEHIIDVSDIVPFAQEVVKIYRDATPANVLEDLRQTITSRRRSADWYQSQSLNDLSLDQSNKSHKHFNGVLDQLLGVLASSHLRGKEIAPKEPVAVSEGDTDSHPVKQNPFDILELESLTIADQHENKATKPETVASPEPKPKKPQTKKSKINKPQTKKKYLFQDPKDDIPVAVFKMLADLHRVRRHIHERLEQYRAHSQSLVSVSAVINCAIGLVRGIEREFMDSFPQFDSWEKVMDTMVTSTQFEKISTGSFVYTETAYLRSLYCQPFEELRRFRESLVRGTMTKHLSGPVPILRVESSQIDNQDNWKADKIILHEFLQEILSLGCSQSLPSEDELTRGVVEVFKDRPVHLWVVFGLQIFLDTQRILGDEVTRPFREFRASCDTYRVNIDLYIKNAQIAGRKPFSKENQDAIRNNSTELSKWITDDIFMQKRQSHPQMGPGRPFFFLSHNLVVCGLLQFATLLRSQFGGILTMNISLYAVVSAHLYNAARNEGYLPNRWADMENLIALYGNYIFVGGPRKKSSAYVMSYLYARGVSVTVLANENMGTLKYSSRGPRELEVPKIMATFEKLLCQRDATKTDKDVDLMMKFLHQTARQQGMQNEGSSHILSPIRLLLLLEQCIEEEEAKLVFDYWALHWSCWTLLFGIYTELQAEFTSFLPPETRKLNPNDQLHILPALIFALLEHEDGKKSVGKENLLARAGRVMDAYITKKAQSPNPTTVGVVNDDGLKTETEHGTQNDECIHWGECDRMKRGVQG